MMNHSGGNWEVMGPGFSMFLPNHQNLESSMSYSSDQKGTKGILIFFKKFNKKLLNNHNFRRKRTKLQKLTNLSFQSQEIRKRVMKDKCVKTQELYGNFF